MSPKALVPLMVASIAAVGFLLWAGMYLLTGHAF